MGVEDGGINKWCSLSKGKLEEDVSDFVNKFFDSDSELNVPLKKLRGVKKKEKLAVLDRRTQSNFFKLFMQILIWNIRRIRLLKSKLQRLMNKSWSLVVAFLEHFLSSNKCR